MIPEYLKLLKKVNPTPDFIIAHLEDEIEKTIPIKKTSKSVKWSSIEQVLSGLNWEWLEALDENENCVWTYQNETENEGENIELVKINHGRDAQLLEMLTKAQAMVLSEVRQSQEVLVNGYRDLTEVLVDRVAHLEDKHQTMIDELARLHGAKTSENEDNQMVKMLMGQLMNKVSPDMVGQLASSLLGGNKPKQLEEKNSGSEDE